MAGWGKTGKTPPLLLDDILHYDLNVPAAWGHHPWRDGPPVYEEDEVFEIERRKKSCKHQYILKQNQSSVPALDERPEADTVYSVAAICEKCRGHLDLEVNHPNLWQLKPCPNLSRPFHHLVFSSEDVDYSEDDAPQGLGAGYRQKFVFQCSWPECAATVYVKLKEPVIKADVIHQLIDSQLLSQRQEEVIKAEPQKFEGMSKAEKFDVLSDLRTYIRNAYDKARSAGNSGGKIQLQNKRFMMRFGLGGMPCQSALESFGFVLKPNEYWDPPHPNLDDTVPLKDPFNVFLDDADRELTILMQQYPPRLRVQSIEPVPIPALREMNRVLGSQDYDKSPVARTQDTNPMIPWYRGLGILPDVSDESVVYAYERQCSIDPTNSHRYFDYLKSITHQRNTEMLQMKFVVEESAGKYTASQLDSALTHFGFDPRDPPTNENHIIGVFSSRLEDAPMHEREMREELRIIGTHLKSQKILDVADDSLTTYDQALAFLDVTRDTPDDFITATIAVKIGDNMTVEERKRVNDQCRKAVKIIADHRHSLALNQWLQTGELGNVEMDVGEAFSLLGIDDQTLDDQMVLTTYQLRLEDNKDNADTYNRALCAIAKHKNSIYLEQFLAGHGLATDRAPPDWPVGLGNIGNTCYLNSLLQFCFTIKGIRDIVLNFDDYRMEINGETLPHKKVGSRKVHREEVRRAQQFAEELRMLFQSMITTPRASIIPKEQLARLTLIGPNTYEAARRRSTLHGQPPILNTVEEIAAADPAPAAEEALMADAPSETAESPVDATLNTSEGFATNASSETTLASRQNTPEDEIMVDVDSKEQQREQESILNNKENLPPSKSDAVEAATTSEPQEAAPLAEASPSKINAQAGFFEKGTEVQEVASPTQLDPPPVLDPPNRRPPPVPPRPQLQGKDKSLERPGPPQRKSTIADLEDITKQQDVTEVMSNVLFQLSCAIKPTGFDKDGEQVDQIKDIFYGKTKTTTLQHGQEPIQEIQRFSDIKVNVADGPRDIYQALEAAFDAEEVISNGNPAQQYSSITQLPPIFQVQIQRTQFDFALKRTYKSVNHLELFQTIFLDRFLDEDVDSSLMERRREAWEWKRELATLETMQAELSETKDQPDASQALDEAREVLESLQQSTSLSSSDDSSIASLTTNTLPLLSELSTTAKSALSSLTVNIATLRQKIKTQYTDLRHHPYSLHSIFVHRGTSNFGHYWIYIYDFKREIWRKYNDSTVTEVSHDEVFLDLEKPPVGGGSPATSVYLVYVKEEDRDNLVEAVCRDPFDDTINEQGITDQGVGSNGGSAGASPTRMPDIQMDAGPQQDDMMHASITGDDDTNPDPVADVAAASNWNDAEARIEVEEQVGGDGMKW